MLQFQRAIHTYIHTPSNCPRLTKFSLQPPKSVEVEYANGSVYKLSAEFLRIYSPAADSKIRSVGGEKVIYGRRHVGIMSGEPVGNYGVRLLFDDLHKTGIYTWDYLYHIGSNKFTLMRNYIRTLKKHGLSRDPPRRKMGDAACVMHPFSYTSGLSDESHQMNPLHALGESVSFGRFMTDSSLSWEKWSTFTQNRHVEEAERYAQPGSVAEKKAFFEAHYKRIAAAKKAAALLEQENAAKDTAEPEFGPGGCIDTTSDAENSSLECQEQILIKIKSGKENVMVSAEEDESNSKANYAIPDELGLGKVGVMEMDTEAKVLGEIAMNIGSEDPPENFEDKNMVSGLENHLLKDAVQMDRKKRPVLSTLKSSVFRKVTSTPAKSMPPLPPRKENSYTPATIRSTMESTDKKRSTPKSLRRFINFTPTRRPEKLSTPAARKIESSAADTNSYKANKDCATPSKTPASLSGMPKHPLVTPLTESKRDNELLDLLAPGSKTSGPKWHLLSSVCSKSLSACRKKLQSSTLSTPFTLRTEERAARRKQKLEDRFNEKEAQNVQRQAKLKEKAETEVGTFGPSLCFRARPLPEFYRERETSKKQTKKAPEMHPQAPKQVGKKANSNSIQGTNPFAKSSTNSLRNFLKKNTQE